MAEYVGGQYNSGTGRPMGLGYIATEKITFKRKYRWSFFINTDCGTTIPESFVKIAARPNLSIEETEINFLNGKMWIPGKASWETLTVTYYDVGGDNGVGALFQWLATTFNFLDPLGLHQSSRRGGGSGYSATGYLNLYDGCGEVMEEWILSHMWPQAINFGELDYSSSEEATIELTLRFSECQYIPGCGVQIRKPCCGGCN